MHADGCKIVGAIVFVLSVCICAHLWLTFFRLWRGLWSSSLSSLSGLPRPIGDDFSEHAFDAADVLAQGMGLPRPVVGLGAVVAILCLAAPVFGLLGAFVHDRRQRRWRYPVLAVYYAALLTCFALGRFDDTPDPTGEAAAWGFCAVRPVGFGLGCWLVSAGPAADSR